MNKMTTLGVTIAVLATGIFGSVAVTAANASIFGNLGGGWDAGSARPGSDINI